MDRTANKAITTERIYGPGHTPDSRVLLAGKGKLVDRALIEGATPDGSEPSTDDPPTPDPAERLVKHKGGIWELPNGDKVRGKAKALEALANLDAAQSAGAGDGDQGSTPEGSEPSSDDPPDPTPPAD